MKNSAILAKYLIEIRENLDELIDMLTDDFNVEGTRAMEFASFLEQNIASIKERLVAK